MRIRQKIKENALASLKHHWGRAISILLFLGAVNILFILFEQLFCDLLAANTDNVPLLVLDLFHERLEVSPAMAIVTGTFMLVSFVITTPLLFGVTKWYWHQVGGERPAILTIFSYFYGGKVLLRSIFLRIMVGIRMVLWGILFALPSAFIFLTLDWFGGSTTSYAILVRVGLVLLGTVVTAVMGILWFYWVQRYFLVDFLFVSDETIGLHAAIRQSVQQMKKQRGQVTMLFLSFLPWLFLGVLLFPLLFVMPYLFASTAINARVLLEGIKHTETTEIQTEQAPLAGNRNAHEI